MGREADTSEYTHGQIIALSTLGYSQRTYAKRLKFSKFAVQILSKCMEAKLLHLPHVLNGVESGEMIGVQAYHPTHCTFNASDGHPSARTVRRLVYDFELSARRTAKNPPITKVRRQKKVEFLLCLQKQMGRLIGQSSLQ